MSRGSLQGKDYLQHGRGGDSGARDVYSSDASWCLYAQETLWGENLSRSFKLKIPFGWRWVVSLVNGAEAEMDGLIDVTCTIYPLFDKVFNLHGEYFLEGNEFK